MRKQIIFALTMAFVVAVTCAAYAEVQNVKLGGDLTTLGVSRYGFNLREEKTDLSGLAMIANVKINADLTDNVSTTVVLRNERVWGTTGRSGTGDLDVYLAAGYATLKEFVYPQLALKIGQMPVRLGSGLLVGDPNTNQTSTGPFVNELADLCPRKAFTGMIADIDLSEFLPLKITAGGIKVTERSMTVAGSTADDDENAYLVNAAYDTGIKQTIGELYYVLKDTMKADVNNFGTRITSVPLENLNVSAEFAYQLRKGIRGDNENANDYALLVGTNYTFADVKMKPSVGFDYTRLTRNWDPMYEDVSVGDIVNAILPNTDAQVIGATISAQPLEDVTLKLRYANLRLVDELAALTGWAGGTAYTMTDKKDVGNEIDLSLTYDYTEDVQLGLKTGYFDPGGAFDKQANRESASQVIGSMKVTF